MRSYTYSTSNELEAGYKINIEGTYTEAVGVSIRQSSEQALIYTSARCILYLYTLLTGYYTYSLKAQPTGLHHHVCRGGEICVKEVPIHFIGLQDTVQYVEVLSHINFFAANLVFFLETSIELVTSKREIRRKDDKLILTKL